LGQPPPLLVDVDDDDVDDDEVAVPVAPFEREAGKQTPLSQVSPDRQAWP
jgi:hypothetical protein